MAGGTTGGDGMSTVDTAEWVGAIATALAVIVALLKEEIVALWRRPSLNALVRLRPPDCHKTELTKLVWGIVTAEPNPSVGGHVQCYYLRLWVENKGKRAEKVQVFASKLQRRQADGTFRDDDRFLPMNLKWSHSQLTIGGPEIFAEGISRDMGKHCDLGHIIEPKFRSDFGATLPGVAADQTILELDLEFAPNTLSHLIPPGVYRLMLLIAAANAEPVKKTIEITLTGTWYDDEERMFSDGIGLREVA